MPNAIPLTGRNTTVATVIISVIISKVISEDDAFHTVRLDDGSSDDGSKNGNWLTPAVAITPAMQSPLHTKASPRNRPIASRSPASTALPSPTIGAATANRTTP
jgi:hypothetical protein